MECKFCKSKNKDEEVVKFDGLEIPKNEYFWYIGSTIHNDWNQRRYKSQNKSMVEKVESA